jgi:hypothetical protein
MADPVVVGAQHGAHAPALPIAPRCYLGLRPEEAVMHLLLLVFLLWLLMRPRSMSDGIGCLVLLIVLFFFFVAYEVVSTLRFLLTHSLHIPIN